MENVIVRGAKLECRRRSLAELAELADMPMSVKFRRALRKAGRKVWAASFCWGAGSRARAIKRDADACEFADYGEMVLVSDARAVQVELDRRQAKRGAERVAAGLPDFNLDGCTRWRNYTMEYTGVK